MSRSILFSSLKYGRIRFMSIEGGSNNRPNLSHINTKEIKAQGGVARQVDRKSVEVVTFPPEKPKERELRQIIEDYYNKINGSLDHMHAVLDAQQKVLSSPHITFDEGSDLLITLLGESQRRLSRFPKGTRGLKTEVDKVTTYSNIVQQQKKKHAFEMQRRGDKRTGTRGINTV